MGNTFSLMKLMTPIVAMDAGIQGACYVLAATIQTEKFFDISASATYVGLILYSVQRALQRQGGNLSARQVAAAAQVCTWAVRLGSFLLGRVMRDGKDSRFDKVKTRPARFLVFWAVQAVWILLTALPVYIIALFLRAIT